jgi:acyl-coenzyme A thioesterase PaaI-like protein
LLTFARLPMSAISTHGFARPPAQIGEVQRRRVVAPPEGTVYDRMGLDVVDAASGVTELARTPYVTNSIGTINGGAQCVMIQVAAEAMCPGLVATDLEVHFLSQVKVGPARSCGRVARHGADHSVITVELVDHGADDQVLSLATVTLQRPPA